jgi:hypothetical protein
VPPTRRTGANDDYTDTSLRKFISGRDEIRDRKHSH